MTNKPVARVRPLSAHPAVSGSAPRVAAVAGLIGALAASSCCIAPLMLFTLGVSGAWISHLTRLAPYQTYFLAVSAVSLGYGYWQVYRSRRGCAGGEACSQPLPSRVVLSGLIAATVLFAAALAFDAVALLSLR